MGSIYPSICTRRWATTPCWRARLNLEEVTPFGEYQGAPVGMVGRLPATVSLGDFTAQVEKVLEDQIIQIWPFGSPNVRQVGIVSGGAAFLLDQAAAAGVDVYLTGEVSHGSYHTAHELGLNVVFGGHYATETAGLKALAGHLEDKFDLETVFLDLPTWGVILAVLTGRGRRRCD